MDLCNVVVNLTANNCKRCATVQWNISKASDNCVKLHSCFAASKLSVMLEK